MHRHHAGHHHRHGWRGFLKSAASSAYGVANAAYKNRHLIHMTYKEAMKLRDKWKRNLSSAVKGGNYKGASHTGGSTRQMAPTSVVTSAQHADMDLEKKKIILGLPKKLFKPLGKWDYRWTVRGSTQGIQIEGYDYAVDMVAFLTVPWSVAAPNNNRSNPYGLQSNVFDLNPYQVNSGGTVIGSLTVPDINSDYVHIHDIESQYMITNFGNVSAEITVKWFLAKHDNQLTPTRQWTDAVQKKKLAQNIEAPAVSTASGVATAGYPYISPLGVYAADGVQVHGGMMPEAEKQFRSNYKCIDKSVFVLNGGDTRRIRMKMEINKTLSKSFAQQQNTIGISYTKGRTIFATIIVRPSIVLVGDTGGNVEPTTGIVPIAWVIQNKVNISSLGASRLEYDRAFGQTVAGKTTLVGAHTTVEEVTNDMDAVSTTVAAPF